MAVVKLPAEVWARIEADGEGWTVVEGMVREVVNGIPTIYHPPQPPADLVALTKECETCEWMPGFVTHVLGVDHPMQPCPDCCNGRKIEPVEVKCDLAEELRWAAQKLYAIEVRRQSIGFDDHYSDTVVEVQHRLAAVQHGYATVGHVTVTSDVLQVVGEGPDRPPSFPAIVVGDDGTCWLLRHEYQILKGWEEEPITLPGDPQPGMFAAHLTVVPS